MSDITKKIHSIEPESSNGAASEGTLKLKPLPDLPIERDIPDFVKRRSDMNPTLYKQSKSGQGYLWGGICLALLWLALGVALLFTRGIDIVQSWGTFEYILVGVVILMPAILILFLSLTLKRLSQTNTDAIRLSDISAQLLKADESAAASTTSLATAIRSSLNALDSDFARLNANLEQLKNDSTSHVEQLHKATNFALNTSETVAKNFTTQKETFGAAHHTLEENLSRLTAEFESKRDALLKLTEEAQSVTEKSVETLDTKLGVISQKVEDISAKDHEASQKLSDLDAIALGSVQMFETKIKQLDDVAQKLNIENATFDKLVNKRAQELSQIAELNQMTDTSFVDYIEHSKSLSSELQALTNAADKTLAAHLEAFRQEMSRGQAQSTESLNAYNTTAADTLAQYTEHASRLEQKIAKLQSNVTELDARLQLNADNRELGLDTPPQTSGARHTKPIGLRPLKTEPVEPEADDFISEAPLPLEDIEILADIEILGDTDEADDDKNTPLEIPKEPTVSKKKSLFGSSPEVSEPPEHADIVMPIPEPGMADDDPFTLQVMDEEQDLLKPLADTSSSLFGRKKEEQKTKSQWRWRDMLGGFDSREANDVPEASSDLTENEATRVPVSSQQPFENIVEAMGIDPERAVSAQLISKISAALITDEKLVKIVASDGLTELSAYIRAHRHYDEVYQNSAAYYEAQYLKTINPEIMNKEAIQTKLDSDAGRYFIISLLG